MAWTRDGLEFLGGRDLERGAPRLHAVGAVTDATNDAVTALLGVIFLLVTLAVFAADAPLAIGAGLAAAVVVGGLLARAPNRVRTGAIAIPVLAPETLSPHRGGTRAVLAAIREEVPPVVLLVTCGNLLGGTTATVVVAVLLLALTGGRLGAALLRRAVFTRWQRARQLDLVEISCESKSQMVAQLRGRRAAR